MSNKPFRFKQFSINQDKTAMKVGTDGVLLGAWSDVENAKIILDVGTGTGLISLMFAQRNFDVKIDAIEIEENAYLQAQENFEKSNFSHQITVHHQDFKTYYSSEKYDLIVSNPPYFVENKRLEESSRKQARQQYNLSFDDLIFKMSELLTKDGNICLILPYNSLEEIISIAKKNQLFLTKLTYIKGNLTSDYVRVLLNFSFVEKDFEQNELIIEKARHQYTEDYINLTKDFYLKM